MDNEWIEISCDTAEWDRFRDKNTFLLFIHLLLRASFEGDTLTLVTTHRRLSCETGLSTKQLRTVLKRLKLANEIKIQIKHRHSYITILNNGLYRVPQSFEVDKAQRIRKQEGGKINAGH